MGLKSHFRKRIALKYLTSRWTSWDIYIFHSVSHINFYFLNIKKWGVFPSKSQIWLRLKNILQICCLCSIMKFEGSVRGVEQKELEAWTKIGLLLVSPRTRYTAAPLSLWQKYQALLSFGAKMFTWIPILFTINPVWCLRFSSFPMASNRSWQCGQTCHCGRKWGSKAAEPWVSAKSRTYSQKAKKEGQCLCFLNKKER